MQNSSLSVTRDSMNDDECSTSDYPCGVCYDNCDGYKDVGCDKCEHWFHQKCEGLSNSDFNYLQKCTLPYICSRCCENNLGVFDYDRSLDRLEFAIQSGCFEMGIRMETIFMRAQPKRLPPGPSFEFKQLAMGRDNVASQLVGKSDYVPVSVKGNGDCLFNAISMAIHGDEKLASEVRVRTCLEMFYFKDYYISSHKRDKLSCVSPPYEEALKDCSQKFKFSCAWTLHAAASVISRCIKSLYPSVNGLLDPSFISLNCEFQPRALKSKHTINILWSSMLPHSSDYWVTNHFVPLLPPSPKNVIDLTQTSPGGLASPDISASEVSSTSTSGSDHPDGMHKAQASLNNTNQNCDQNQQPLAYVIDHPYTKPNPQSTDIDNSVVNDTKFIFNESVLKFPNGSIDKSFFNAEDLLGILQFYPVSEAHPAIPQGVKNNVYFIVQNTANMVNDKRSSFPDDCGVWSKGSAPKTYLLRQQSGEYRNIFLRNKIYYSSKKQKGRLTYVLLEPQPEPSKIVTLSRYYTTLKLDSSYRRRISCMSSSKVFVVEYLGLFPGLAPHGNAKRKGDYVRTQPNVTQEISDLSKQEKPIDVDSELNANSDNPSGPSSIKKMHGKKHNDRKKRRKESVHVIQEHNIDDHIREIDFLEASTASECLVNSIMRDQEKEPCLTLYTDNQIMDIN